jgi:serine/threonine protein kinase
MFRENQQIGLYTLIRKLGRGGFGEVWLAERKSKFVTTKVAVKLPLDEQVDHEAIKQEATLWEQASGHPNILPIIDADEYDGQIVIVSEYAPDGSLEQWLKQNGKMSIEKAVEITIQILDGLEFLHSRNIIHRDLKPANILLQGKTPRLADFGISRALRTTVASQSQNISGTFAYMSPEALDGKRSIQTDIWSVGVNLYQFLTGSLPYPQKEPSALITAIMMRDFISLPDYVPEGLKKVIGKALAKQPEVRHKTVSELREDLVKILRGGTETNFVKPSSPDTESKILNGKVETEIETQVKIRQPLASKVKPKDVNEERDSVQSKVISPPTKLQNIILKIKQLVVPSSLEQLETRLNTSHPSTIDERNKRRERERLMGKREGEERGFPKNMPRKYWGEPESYWYIRVLTQSILDKHCRNPQDNMELLTKYLNSRLSADKIIHNFSFDEGERENLKFLTRLETICFNIHKPIYKADFLKRFNLE